MADEIERTLSNEEDTSTENGPAEENESEEESDAAEGTASQNESEESEEATDDESPEALKARLRQAEEDRDNYKRGMLAAKAKDRKIEPAPALKRTEDVSERKVLDVIHRENEKRVLRDVIDPQSRNYMPELVEDKNFADIVGYLPRSIDKSSEESIRRALKVAREAWKYDRGITGKKPKQDKPEADLADSTSRPGGGEGGRSEAKRPQGRKLLKPAGGMESWFPKKE